VIRLMEAHSCTRKTEIAIWLVCWMMTWPGIGTPDESRAVAWTVARLPRVNKAAKQAEVRVDYWVGIDFCDGVETVMFRLHIDG